MYRWLLAAAVLALWAAPSLAKVASTTLRELVAGANVIAIAEDVELFEVEGWTIARARIAHTLKGGELGPDLYYLASPTWTCDIAHGKVGEQAVLFLREPPPEYRTPRRDLGRIQPALGRNTIYLVAHAGRGRMPIYFRGHSRYAEIWTNDIRLPQGVTTEPGREAEYADFIRGVRLDVLETTVTQLVRGKMPSS